MGYLRLLVAAVGIAVLTACGGGGGSPGVDVKNPANTTTVSVTATDLVVSLDKVTLSNTGTDRVVLDVVAVNSTGNAVADAPITVNVDNGAVFQGSSAASNGSFRTDPSGKFSGQITSPGNKANRTINVVVKSGNTTKNLTIAVIGTQISLTPVPGAPLVGQPVSLTLRVADANDVGIAGVSLTLGGSAGFIGVFTTDINGNVVVSRSAPASAGVFEVTVSGSGVNQSFPLTVVSAASGIPDAIGPLGLGSLGAVPTNVSVNLTSSSDNRSAITFKMVNPNNQPVANVRVKFNIVAPGLGAGERMSTGDSVVYTNTSGEVTSDYIPGTRSSPNDGVLIRACFGATDALLSECATPVFARLTVRGRPLNISIFDNNTLFGKFNNTVYVQTLVLQVVDSANNPVRDALVSASADVTHYGKGPTWNQRFASPAGAPSINDTYTNTLDASLVPTRTVVDGSGTVVTLGQNVWCINEDLNRNGTRDSGEDLDSDGVLEPRVSDVSVSTPNGNKTDLNGNLLIDVALGQNVGGWLAYTVKISTSVQGSEGTNSRSFITGVLRDDVTNGAFLTPPYGINNCRTNN
jgi:hypothetical protein